MNMIMASDLNNGIGYNGELLFKAKQDMKRFKNLTLNKIVIMGYNTYQSLSNCYLPNRINIVLTHKDIKVENENIIIVHSLNELWDILKNYNDNEIFVIGGAEIYKLLEPYCDKLYLTKWNHRFEKCDTYFPISDEWIFRFKKNFYDNNEFLIEDGIDYEFIEYEKKVEDFKF